VIRQHKLANGFGVKDLAAGVIIAIEEDRLKANRRSGPTLDPAHHRRHGLGPPLPG